MYSIDEGKEHNVIIRNTGLTVNCPQDKDNRVVVRNQDMIITNNSTGDSIEVSNRDTIVANYGVILSVNGIPYLGATADLNLGIHNLITGGTVTAGTITDGVATLSNGSLTLVKLGSLTTNGFVRTSNGDGTLYIDNSNYIAEAPNDIHYYGRHNFNWTNLDNIYLGISAQAVDSAKLNGQYASYYYQSSNPSNYLIKSQTDTYYYPLTTNPSGYINESIGDIRYLGISSQAADSNRLNGQLSSYYYQSSNPSNYLNKLQTDTYYYPLSNNPSGYLNNSTGDVRYLGINNQAVDSNKLNGQLASFYYAASNPSEYITSSALSPYWPTSGGTATGDWTIGSHNFSTTGKITTGTLQITTSPTNGYILTSDASGNATWQVNAGGGYNSSTIAGPLYDNSGILSVRQAGLAMSGYLSSDDWNTFYNKVSEALNDSHYYGRHADGWSNLDNIYYPLATNPSGYLANITSTIIDNALGYVPYNANVNPSGYVNGSYYPLAINPSGYLVKTITDGYYYPLSSNPSAYVTYVGASGNVNLGAHSITADTVTGNTSVTTGALFSNTIYSETGNNITFGNIGTTTFSGAVALGSNTLTTTGNIYAAAEYLSSSGVFQNISTKSITASGDITSTGVITGSTIIKSGGTSSQFLKANGSVDSSTYLTTGSATSTYVPYSGATQTPNLGTYGLTTTGDIHAANEYLSASGIFQNISTASVLASGNITLTGNIVASASGTENIGTASTPFNNGYFNNIYGNGANLTGVTTTNSKSFVITNPTSSANGPIWRVPQAITLTGEHVLCVGGTNIVGNLAIYNTGGASGVSVNSTNITSASGVTADEWTFTNSTVPSGYYLGWMTASASGSVQQAIITFEYR